MGKGGRRGKEEEGGGGRGEEGGGGGGGGGEERGGADVPELLAVCSGRQVPHIRLPPVRGGRRLKLTHLLLTAT